jgi:hypothetical protein
MKHPMMHLLHIPMIVCVISLVACSRSEEDWMKVPLAENTYFDSDKAYRESEYEILVLNQSAREFKLALDEGDAITYRWTVEMESPELLTVEFHGHTHRVGDEPGTVMFYKIHNDGQESGALIAPFDGIHGWYLNNDSPEDITIRLEVAGFFEDVD